MTSVINKKLYERLIQAAKDMTDDDSKKMVKMLTKKLEERDCKYCKNTGWCFAEEGYGVYSCDHCFRGGCQGRWKVR